MHDEGGSVTHLLKGSRCLAGTALRRDDSETEPQPS